MIGRHSGLIPRIAAFDHLSSRTLRDCTSTRPSLVDSGEKDLRGGRGTPCRSDYSEK